MKKIPIGVSNYESLIEDGYYYVDKTKYIEELENMNNTYLVFFRPRRFGKSLFTSVLENYYDILKKDKFDELFKNTYIGKNPTKNKNRYYILKFDFSGMDSSSKEKMVESILEGFISKFEGTMENNKIYVIIDEYDHCTAYHICNRQSLNSYESD